MQFHWQKWACELVSPLGEEQERCWVLITISLVKAFICTEPTKILPKKMWWGEGCQRFHCWKPAAAYCLGNLSPWLHYFCFEMVTVLLRDITSLVHNVDKHEWQAGNMRSKSTKEKYNQQIRYTCISELRRKETKGVL